MYEAFYGLKEKPFNLTPDPKYLYLSEKHKEAFAHLLYGIKQRSGFIMVSGEIGTGKTTICRTLLSQLDDATEVAFIFNPTLSPEELLRQINEDFGIDSKAETVKGLIDELNTYLLERNALGKNCVLVIDEAQDLAPGVLEQIRLLSNLETTTQKLLQIVLIGQPELMDSLLLPELRQLNQRITARYHLEALDEHETMQYIAYRLRVAGGRRRARFTRGAVSQIYKFSKGTPRVINALCDRALLIGYTKEVRDITARMIKRAARETQGHRHKPRRGIPWKALMPNPTVVVAALLLLAAVVYSVDRLTAAPGDAPMHTQAWSRLTGTPVEGAPEPPGDGPASLTAPVAFLNDEGAPEPATPIHSRFVEPTFVDTLDRLDPDTARNGAATAVLRAWQIALLSSWPEDDSIESLTEFATKNGVAIETFSPTLEQLETINLPAMVQLRGSHQLVWCALIGVENGMLRVTTGISESELVSRQAFKSRYTYQAAILWRDTEAETPVLRPDSEGEDVQVLQAQLRSLGRLHARPNGEYDSATETAIRELQAETGLKMDGVVGRRTRMVLASWLPGFDTPELRPLDRVAVRDVGRDTSEPKWKVPAKREAPLPAEDEPDLNFVGPPVPTEAPEETTAEAPAAQPVEEGPAPSVAEAPPAPEPKNEVAAEPHAPEPEEAVAETDAPAPAPETEEAIAETDASAPAPMPLQAIAVPEVVDPFGDLDTEGGDVPASVDAPAPVVAPAPAEPPPAESDSDVAPSEPVKAPPAVNDVPAPVVEAPLPEVAPPPQTSAEPASKVPSRAAAFPLVPSGLAVNDSAGDE